MENIENNLNFEINLKKIEEKPQFQINQISEKAIPNKSPQKSSKNSSVSKNSHTNIKKYDIKLSQNEENNISRKLSGKAADNKKDEKKQKINDILSGLKIKNNYQLSPYTDLKSFGELTPGPGQYYNPDIKIGGQNLRYHNLFKDPEYNITLKYKLLKDNYYQSKVGPGTYNINVSYDHKSYSQNPKTFISQLERGNLFKITDSVGPGHYNLANTGQKNKIKNNYSLRKKNKNKFVLKTEPPFNFKSNDLNIFDLNNLNNNIKINNINNLNNKDAPIEDNKSRIASGKISFRGHKNFSWKGISDFSGSGIKYPKKELKDITKEDQIEYKNHEFNFDNQKKLNLNKRNKFSNVTRKIILKEISEYDNINKPLIEYVQKDVVLKGNHLPGPCYYNYTNDSIEGDIKQLSKKYKSNTKKWK